MSNGGNIMKSITLIIFLIFTLFLTGCNDNNTTQNNTDSEAQKTDTQINITKNVINITKGITDGSGMQTEIGTATTEILDDSQGRVKNLEITCRAINNYIVKSGETFSFNNVVGPADSSKGYQEATVLDSEGNKTTGLGGGNCQVSSTLYNAVLNSNLEVVERYEHSRDVAYVEDGKDAAVSYSSEVDFRFKNNLNRDIKILAETDGNNVTVTIFKI